MTNSSATGGYLIPTNVPLPGGLSLQDYIHDVFMGITGIDKTLIRPRWQQNPLPTPDINTDWLAFGITIVPLIGNDAYQEQNPFDSTFIAQEKLEVLCSFYGPNCLDNATLLRDGLKIAQNRDALTAANMGFQDTTDILQVPPLINDRYFDRADMTVILLREIQRSYPILPLVQANGTIETDNEPQIILPFSTTNVEE